MLNRNLVVHENDCQYQYDEVRLEHIWKRPLSGLAFYWASFAVTWLWSRYDSLREVHDCAPVREFDGCFLKLQ